MTGFTCDELSAAVAAAVADTAKPDDVPPGWFTVRQIANEVKRSRNLYGQGCWARKVARALVAGKPCKVFRITNGLRGLYPIEHYKL